MARRVVVAAAVTAVIDNDDDDDDGGETVWSSRRAWRGSIECIMVSNRIELNESGGRS